MYVITNKNICYAMQLTWMHATYTCLSAILCANRNLKRSCFIVLPVTRHQMQLFSQTRFFFQLIICKKRKKYKQNVTQILVVSGVPLYFLNSFIIKIWMKCISYKWWNSYRVHKRQRKKFCSFTTTPWKRVYFSFESI